MTNPDNVGGLPELPDPCRRKCYGELFEYFDADQMRAYGELCRAAPAGGDAEARDAARYRWLAENAIIQWPGVTHIGDDPASTRLPLDNAIDAAMIVEDSTGQTSRGDAPCDMGEMCLGCTPRNADGSCPDAAPAGGDVAVGEIGELNGTKLIVGRDEDALARLPKGTKLYTRPQDSAPAGSGEVEDWMVELFDEVYEREWNRAADEADDRHKTIIGPADRHATREAIAALLRKLSTAGSGRLNEDQ